VLFNVVGNALKFTEKGQVKIKAWAEPLAAVPPHPRPLPEGEGATSAAPHSSQASEQHDQRTTVLPLLGERAGVRENPAPERPVAVGNPREPDETHVNLILEVSDTGIGIPKTQQEHIFGAFSQVAGQSTRKFGGTGLGLTITKRLTEMMHGVITVRSEQEQTVWPRLCKTRVMGEIEAFAQRLRGWAEAGHWPALGSYAETLDQQVQEFDLSRLPQTLQRFPAVIASLS